jgi:hypothetical protein
LTAVYQILRVMRRRLWSERGHLTRRGILSGDRVTSSLRRRGAVSNQVGRGFFDARVKLPILQDVITSQGSSCPFSRRLAWSSPLQDAGPPFRQDLPGPLRRRRNVIGGEGRKGRRMEDGGRRRVHLREETAGSKAAGHLVVRLFLYLHPRPVPYSLGTWSVAARGRPDYSLGWYTGAGALPSSVRSPF